MRVSTLTAKPLVPAGTLTLKLPSAATATVWLTPPITTVTVVPVKSTPFSAVPPARVRLTVVALVLALDRVTVKVLALPSATLSPATPLTFGRSASSVMIDSVLPLVALISIASNAVLVFTPLIEAVSFSLPS